MTQPDFQSTFPYWYRVTCYCVPPLGMFALMVGVILGQPIPLGVAAAFGCLQLHVLRVVLVIRSRGSGIDNDTKRLS